MKRETEETFVKLEEAPTKTKIDTTVKMFDHLLSQMAKFGDLRFELTARGDNQHHIIEDVAICLGQEFRKRLGSIRMGYTIVPMDDALVMVAIDVGRAYSQNSFETVDDVDGIRGTELKHFFDTFAVNASINLHIVVFSGINGHHIAEAVFKAFGIVLGQLLGR